MDPSAMTTEMRALLDHTRWVQELAHRLVRDPDEADELAQETMLAALRSRSGPPRSMRAWLGTVLRNLLFERMRGEGRRDAREETVARDEATPSTLELYERMSIHRQVVELVMDLPELYREVLLRRYFEGEMPARIAEQLGVPVATVKTRLQRALAAMRERLDRAHGGDGESWLSALAPLVARRSTALPAAAGSGLLVAGGLVVLTVAIAAWVALDTDGATDANERLAARPATTPGDRPSAPEELVVPPSDRRPTAEPASPAREEEFAATVRELMDAGRAPLRGRVLTADGRPAPGVLLRFETLAESTADPGERAEAGGGVSVALSDGAGRFELAPSSGSGRVVAAGSDRVTLFAGVPGAFGQSGELTVVVAPRRPLMGRVVDPEGRPLAEARLAVEWPDDLRQRFEGSLANAAPLYLRTRTEEGGRFDLGGVPRVAGARVRVEREGFEGTSLLLDDDLPVPLELVLERPSVVPGMLIGRVVDALGRAVPDASVSSGSVVARTDGAGRFAIAPPDPGAPLMAVAPGHGAALVEPATGGAPWPEDLLLELPPAPATIVGRVVDPTGRGLRGVQVWIEDATLFSRPEESGPGTPDVESRSRFASERSFDVPDTLERRLAAPESRLRDGLRVRTLEDGTFRLDALADRPYSIGAMEDRGLVTTIVHDVPAGSQDLELTLDPADVVPLVEGRVVTADGRPVAGVDVRARRSAWCVRDGERTLYTEVETGARTRTDAEGRFRLRDTSVESVRLLFEGRHVVARTLELDGSGAPAEELLVEVALKSLVRISLREPVDRGTVSFQDADGVDLELQSIRGSERLSSKDAPVAGGRTEVWIVPDTALRATLSVDGEVRRTWSVRLVPGEHNELVL